MIASRVDSSASARAIAAPLLASIGGGAIVLGCWLPWMYYFAGLVPLRGVIGINGRLLIAAGIAGLALAAALAVREAPRLRAFACRATTTLGLTVACAAMWLLVGVRELTHVRASNAMLAPKGGVGLIVVLVGGMLLVFSAHLAVRSTRR